MPTTESIFHRLQKEGTKALEVYNVREGFVLDTTPFMAKVSNFYKDQFPVFVVKLSEAMTLRERFIQIQSANGFPFKEESLSDEDIDAARVLLIEEKLKCRLPAKRFGIEIQHDDGAINALVIEAMSSAGANGVVPYNNPEFTDKKLSECNFLCIHYLYIGNPGLHPNQNKITLDNTCLFLDILHSIQQGKIGSAPAKLSRDAAVVIKVPDNYRHASSVSDKDLFYQEKPQSQEGYFNQVAKLMDIMMDLLWVLDREPTFVTMDSKEFTQENKLRRVRRLTPFSPFRVIHINHEELRRVEFRRASEIADAITNKGGYKIPGLVLVGKYKKPSTGAFVEAYARCADDIVRTEATRFLREENYQELAELVRDFGHRTTQAQFGLSKAYIPRVS